MSADPRAVLLTQQDVAQRLAWDVRKVARARVATDPHGDPRPMPGWKNTGTTRKPRYSISEAALIAGCGPSSQQHDRRPQHDLDHRTH